MVAVYARGVEMLSCNKLLALILMGVLLSQFSTTLSFRFTSLLLGSNRQLSRQRNIDRRSKIFKMAIHVDEVTIKVPNNKLLQQLSHFYDNKLRKIESSSDQLMLSFGEKGRIIFNNHDKQFTPIVGKGYTGVMLARRNAHILMNESTTNDNVLRTFNNYKIGASLIPDEDEMKQFDVQYGWLEDPAGYRLELQQSPIEYDRLILKVLDIDESIDFFTNILGFSLLRKRANLNNIPKEASFSAYLGNNNETEDSTIELLYPYSTNHIDQGNLFQEISFRTDSFEKVKEVVEEKNIPIMWSTDGSFAITDPNGYKFRIRQIERSAQNEENLEKEQRE